MLPRYYATILTWMVGNALAYSEATAALYYYYGYRAEFDRFAGDATQMEIGRSLVNPEGDGPLSFRDFYRAVYLARPRYYDVDKSTFDPDDKEKYPKGPGDRETFGRIVADLHGEGFTTPPVLRTKVYPELYSGNNRDPRYLFSAIADRMQDARVAGWTGHLDTMTNAVSIMHEEALADVHNEDPDHNQRLADEFHARFGLVLPIKDDLVSPLGTKYAGIDWFAASDALSKLDTPQGGIDRVAEARNVVYEARIVGDASLNAKLVVLMDDLKTRLSSIC